MTDVVRLLHVGDVHVSDNPPGYRTDSYRDDILAKLQFVMEQSIRSEVDAVLFVGDLFHHRRRVSHALLADVADLLALHPRVVLLPGNHDLIDNVLSEVGRQPIGILARLPNVSLAMRPFVVSSPGKHPKQVHVRITPVPYQQGMNYVDARVVPDPKFTQGAAAARYEMLWVHYGITPRPVPYHTLVVSDDRWQPGDDCDIVVAGHIHDDLDMFSDGPRGPTVVNFGSISRGSLTEDNLTRQPRVPLLTFEPDGRIDVASIDVPCRPSGEVFHLDDKDASDKEKRLASEFLASLDATHLAVLSPEAVRETLHRSGAPEPVVALALQALDEVID